ncbi:MAG: M13 family metallopeptidase N-terminal domain-containing protein, partial [Planctomycetota bacterium]
REMLDAAAKAAPGSNERKAGDFYAAYLDERAIDTRGLTPLQPTLARIAAITDRRALARELGSMLRSDTDPLNFTNYYTDNLFGVFVAQDFNDPSHNTAYLLQGGLGMPDREYYVSETPKMAETRQRYAQHVSTMLRLAGTAIVQDLAAVENDASESVEADSLPEDRSKSFQRKCRGPGSRAQGERVSTAVLVVAVQPRCPTKGVDGVAAEQSRGVDAGRGERRRRLPLRHRRSRTQHSGHRDRYDGSGGVHSWVVAWNSRPSELAGETSTPAHLHCMFGSHTHCMHPVRAPKRR